MKKWAVYYTTFGASPTRVITEAESAEAAIEILRKRMSNCKGFKAYAIKW